MNSIAFFFIILLFLVLLLFIVTDIVIPFWLWQSRIHIGRWQDKADWQKAVGKKCQQWLTHTPTVPIKDHGRLILWDIIRRKYSSPTIQSWQKAGLVLGICSNSENCSFDFYHQIAKESIYASPHIDAALMAYAILASFSKKADELKPLMDEVYQRILDTKGDNDTVPYRKGQVSIRFVDTLGFICPFLTIYAKTYKVDDATLLAQKQLVEYDKALLPNWGFPAHAFNIKQNAPLGLFDWGRGVGWYIIALLGMQRHTSDYESKLKLEERILALGDKLLLCELPAGGFSHQLFNASTPAEGSATVLATLLFKQCYKITNDGKYSKAVDSSLKRLMKMTRRNGALDGCQGDTKGIGFYSSRFDIMPFAQGVLLFTLKD